MEKEQKIAILQRQNTELNQRCRNLQDHCNQLASQVQKLVFESLEDEATITNLKKQVQMLKKKLQFNKEQNRQSQKKDKKKKNPPTQRINNLMKQLYIENKISNKDQQLKRKFSQDQIQSNEINNQIPNQQVIDGKNKRQIWSLLSWSHNLLKQSSILDSYGLNLLMNWLPEPVQKIVLQFKASNNDFMLSKFFKKCGDLKNTIIIVRTTKGKIIGGFTPLSFNPSQESKISGKQNNDLQTNHLKSNIQDEKIKDPSNLSFLFSFSQKAKFPLLEDNYAIRRYKDQSYIEFYSTLKIKDQSNKQSNNVNSFVLWNRNYSNQKYDDNKQSYLKLIGEQEASFLTEQWQVYQVFFA